MTSSEEVFCLATKVAFQCNSQMSADYNFVIESINLLMS